MSHSSFRCIRAARAVGMVALLVVAVVGAAPRAIAQGTPAAVLPACAVIDPAVDPLAALTPLDAFVPVAQAADPAPQPTVVPDPAVASPAAASPAATPALAPARARAVRLAASVVLACAGAADVAAVADRVALPVLRAWYGAGQEITRAQAIALAGMAAPVAQRLVATGEPAVDGAGDVVLPVLYLRGNLLVHAAWRMTEAAATGWLLVAEAPLPPLAAPASAIVEATLADGAITLSTDGIGGPNLVLRVRNDGMGTHEALVLEIPWGVTPPWLFGAGSGGVWPEGVRVAAQVTLGAGGTAELALAGLAPAQYALVCLLPAGDGTPHVAQGEWGMLQIW